MTLTKQRKIELAYEVSQTLTCKANSIEDRIAVIEIVMKSLLAKRRLYNRRQRYGT